MIDMAKTNLYDRGYEEGYEACQLYYERAKKEKRRRLYFLKQKLIGVLMLIFTVFAVRLLEGDATIALITVPLGLLLIFSKEKCWMDNYYYETEYEDEL